jgi:hypothetical protein
LGLVGKSHRILLEMRIIKSTDTTFVTNRPV